MVIALWGLFAFGEAYIRLEGFEANTTHGDVYWALRQVTRHVGAVISAPN